MSATVAEIAAAVRAMAAERTASWAAERNVAAETAAAQADVLREAAGMIEGMGTQAANPKQLAETGTQESAKPAKGKA